MTERRELVVIGAGPAGMHAAISARECGVDVLLVDERGAPGGQIYRDVEAPALGDARRLGHDYARGAALLARFRACGAEYRPDTLVWDVSPQRLLRLSGARGSRAVEAARIVIATGAIERPFPVAGWTLPGVLSAGGAQILLKNAALVPVEPVVLRAAAGEQADNEGGDWQNARGTRDGRAHDRDLRIGKCRHGTSVGRGQQTTPRASIRPSIDLGNIETAMV